MKKRVAKSLSALLCLSVIIAGCSKGTGEGGSTSSPEVKATSTPTETKAPLKHVDLTYYYWGWKTEGEKNVKEVEAAINKYVEPKINATIHLKFQGFGEYAPKINTMLASGEKFDVFWGGFLFGYNENIAKGAFLPINELLDKYAPETKKAVPQWMWDGYKYGDGKIYGIPALQTTYHNTGFAAQKRFVDKYGIDVNKIKKPEDAEPFLEKFVQDNPDWRPLGGYGFDQMADIYYGIETITEATGIRTNDENTKIINYIDTDEMRSYYQLMKKWHDKGYLSQGKKDDDKNKLEGKVFNFTQVVKPGGEAEAIQHLGGNGKQPIVLPDTKSLKAYVPGNMVTTTFNAISRTSANPERAMMFLNMLNSDKELYNLIAHGIEGKHYTKLGANTYKKIPDSGYDPGTDWVFGNSFLSYVLEGQPEDVFVQQEKINNTAQHSRLLGFNFNQEPVQSELANVKNVFNEYNKPLSNGEVDYDKKYPEFLEKLKKAGIDKVIAEMQKQLDEWKAKKK